MWYEHKLLLQWFVCLFHCVLTFSKWRAGQIEPEKYLTPIFLLLFFLYGSFVDSNPRRSSTCKTEQRLMWLCCNHIYLVKHAGACLKMNAYRRFTVKPPLYGRLSSDNAQSRYCFLAGVKFSHLVVSKKTCLPLQPSMESLSRWWHHGNT